MSTLLEQASLVMIPSGYKEDVVYSQIPTDGSGDLSFTRASNGTRINSAGLVEVCPWNLCTNSEDQTQWTSENATTVTANSTTAPNGTLTADTVTPTAVNDDHYRGIVLSSQVGELTAFIYVKPNGYNFFDFGIYNGSTYLVRATFDLVNLTYTFTIAGTATIESVGNGWLKCGISGTNASLTNIGIYYRIRPTDGAGVFTGNGTSGAFIWGAQLNIGSTAKPYFPTTDRLNVPRLTYQNGGGGCPSLLLEKQSTNLATYSEQFDNVNWFKEQASVTANTTTSPDGTQNADSLTENTANDHHLIYQGGTVSAGAYTQSVFIKKNTRQYAFLQIATDTAVNRYTIVVDLDNGSVTATSTEGSPTGTSNKIDSMGNGWYRLTVTATHTAGVVYTVFGLSNSANPTFSSVATPTYTGNGTGSIYIYGAQFEQSSYATSLIPTTSASATRVADASRTTGLSSLIGQSEGALFLDLYYLPLQNQARAISVTETSTPLNNRLIININNTNNRVSVISRQSGSSTSGSIGESASTALLSGRNKIALGYKSGDSALYINGVLVATNSNSFTFSATLNDLFLMTSEIAFVAENVGLVNDSALFKTRLTNAELASLTTI